MGPAEELRYLVLAAQREGNRLLAQALRPLGITPSQAEVIRVVREYQPITLSGLGELLVCESGGNPSRLVDRLVGSGLLRRKVPEQDRRHIELSLTDEGERIARRIAVTEDTLHRAIDAAIEPFDITQVTGFLRAIVANLPAGQALERRAGPRRP